MKYGFQYHGLVNNMNVFTIVTDDESGKRQMGIDICYHHFIQDVTSAEIKHVSYMDGTLARCNTTRVTVSGEKIPSISQQVILEEATSMLDSIKQSEVVLPVIGEVKDINFAIIIEYPILVKHKSGLEDVHFYDGVDMQDAFRKALHNNKTAIGIELFVPQNPYVNYYSEYGLREQIKEAEKKIQDKRREREDVGQSWTPKAIISHKKTIDDDIQSIQVELRKLQLALNMKVGNK